MEVAYSYLPFPNSTEWTGRLGSCYTLTLKIEYVRSASKFRSASKLLLHFIMSKRWEISYVVINLFVWLVLICFKRKVLVAGDWFVTREKYS
jgi:hypothetical protein